MISRLERIKQLFPDEPNFRLSQIEQALFQDGSTSWNNATTLSKTMRETLVAEVQWITVETVTIRESYNGDIIKAVLKLQDGTIIESVLMRNRRGQWTICVSCQVGCAMRCGFCATGRMGLKRNLNRDEIVDQYRFWQIYLYERRLKPATTLEERISNVVLMGMGEPLANYEEVKAALHTILTHTDIGKTRITVSTVGVLPRLEQILTDKDWPHVRLAISLHSAIAKTRKEIVPTSFDDFLPKLKDWSRRYLIRHGNRRHHLTFEYVMLRGINDSLDHARQLASFVRSIGQVKVNLIQYNLTDNNYQCSSPETVGAFMKELETGGITVSVRKTMGDDIAAACGQLIAEQKDKGRQSPQRVTKV